MSVLDGTALQELVAQICAMPGSTFTECARAYADVLREQLKSYDKGSVFWAQTLRLEAYVRGIIRFERDSLLAEQATSPQELSAAA